MKGWYERAVGMALRPLFRIKARKMRDACGGFVKGLVLDVGGGRGYVAQALGRLPGVTVMCADVAPLREVEVRYVVFDGRSLPFRDHQFDAVLLCYVLHHCQDCLPLLRECRRVTRGRLIVVEDTTMTKWSSSLDVIANRIFHNVPTPLTFRARAAWKALFEEVGFSITHVQEGVEEEWFYPFVKRTMFVLDRAA